MTDTQTNLPDPPVFEGDPFEEEVLRNPHPFQDKMREMGGVVWIEKYGFYAITRHEEAQTVLSDYERFTSEGGIGLSDIRDPGAWRPPSPITEVDPPVHTTRRRALTQVMSPKVLRGWRESFETEAAALADRLVAAGEVDGVRDIAEAYVLKVFPDAVGVSAPREAFTVLGEVNMNQLGPNNEITKRSIEAAGEHVARYESYFQREATRPGGFASMIYEAEDAGEFEQGTAGFHVRSFFRAGVDSTISGIGHALLMLAQNPDQWAKLKEKPSLVKGAFEEAIRVEAPIQLICRTTTEAQDFAGYSLKPRTKVGCLIGCANRDPRKFPNPGAFDVERATAGIHVAFGHGPHNCVGQNTARMEAECILGAILSRVERIELAGDYDYKVNNTLRTLRKLPLRLIPA